jgi:hypothetical protein
MAEKKLKTICPHCNRAIQIDMDQDADQEAWLLCTPMPVDESDVRAKASEVK